MNSIDRIYKLFDENVKRARKSYSIKDVKNDKRTARSSSLNNALKNIQKQINEAH